MLPWWASIQDFFPHFGTLCMFCELNIPAFILIALFTALTLQTINIIYFLIIDKMTGNVILYFFLTFYSNFIILTCFLQFKKLLLFLFYLLSLFFFSKS